MLLVTEVTGHRDGPTASVEDPAGRLPRVVLLGLQAGDQHVRPLPGERDRHRTADTGVAAGDDGLLALQAPGTPVAVLTVVGLHVHIAGAARILHRLIAAARSCVLLRGILLGELVLAHGLLFLRNLKIRAPPTFLDVVIAFVSRILISHGDSWLPGFSQLFGIKGHSWPAGESRADILLLHVRFSLLAGQLMGFAAGYPTWAKDKHRPATRPSPKGAGVPARRLAH